MADETVLSAGGSRPPSRSSDALSRYLWATEMRQESSHYKSPYQAQPAMESHNAQSTAHGIASQGPSSREFHHAYSFPRGISDQAQPMQQTPSFYSPSYRNLPPTQPLSNHSIYYSDFHEIAPNLIARRPPPTNPSPRSSHSETRAFDSSQTLQTETQNPASRGDLSHPQYTYSRQNSQTGLHHDISSDTLISSKNKQTLSHSLLPTTEESSENDEESDTEADHLKLQAQLENLDESIFDLNDEGDSSQRGRYRRRIGQPRGIQRGPRKAAAPTGDIKIRLEKATHAFIKQDYAEAQALIEDIICINAETYEAWTLLASVWKELGNIGKASSSLMFAANLRPKDVQGWLNAARFVLEESGDQRPSFLSTAKYCYSSAISANPRYDYEARMGKAAILREMNHTSQAVSEYLRVLQSRPHDTTILRYLAEVYIDRDDAEAAIKLYEKSIAYYQDLDDISGQVFDWSDVNIFVELYGFLGQYQNAIQQIKSLSRWLLGRKHEIYWDSVEDDREWDAKDSRRLQIPEFEGNGMGPSVYGQGLPLELRVKLGLYRLHLGYQEESLNHLVWLDPENLLQEDRVSDYPDLFRDTADSLQDAGLYQDALKYYKALQLVSEADPSLYVRIGLCYAAVQLYEQAEKCLQLAIQAEENHIEARLELAKIYEHLGDHEQAFACINEIMNIRRTGNAKAQPMIRPQGEEPNESHETPNTFMPPPSGKKYYYKSRKMNAAERQKQEELLSEHLRDQHTVLLMQQSKMRDGEQAATVEWMNAASDLIEDFRKVKKFYPWDKHVDSVGYTGPTKQTVTTPLDADTAAMANRISDRLGADIDRKPNVSVDISDYRDISFSDWLDIFLEYALCLAKNGKSRESYNICEAAKEAVVFYHSRENMFLIYVCWCCCALLANDEESCVLTSRYFMKEYQFTTDSYRMFSALARICQSPISWYSSGPSQKYILRQIKTMDYALIDKDSRDKIFVEKAAYSAQDEDGRLVINKEMDIGLLMVYGHILSTGGSQANALNYFFRAYALNPDNPMIVLSIGLAYIHWGLKRQSENRHFHIMQGVTFLFKYYQSRRTSPNVEERQEAHYNIARTYHTIGLTHLALPYYSKVMEELSDRNERGREDLVIDAAFNLQSLYATAGNFDMAKIITDRWLVI